MQLQKRIPPQEFSRIFCYYSYTIEWFSNLECNDLENNGSSGRNFGIRQKGRV